MSQCIYCSNQHTRNVYNPHNGQQERVCEIHYAYLKPQSARLNPSNINRCIRCGTKATTANGAAERLIDHHVNYPLDLTVPVCDSCHATVQHNDGEEFLERHDRETSPYAPRGTPRETGTAIHDDYPNGRATGRDCPSCGAETLRPPNTMGFDKDYLCPDATCHETALDTSEVR